MDLHFLGLIHNACNLELCLHQRTKDKVQRCDRAIQCKITLQFTAAHFPTVNWSTSSQLHQIAILKYTNLTRDLRPALTSYYKRQNSTEFCLPKLFYLQLNWSTSNQLLQTSVKKYIIQQELDTNIQIWLPSPKDKILYKAIELTQVLSTELQRLVITVWAWN